MIVLKVLLGLSIASAIVIGFIIINTKDKDDSDICIFNQEKCRKPIGSCKDCYVYKNSDYYKDKNKE